MNRIPLKETTIISLGLTGLNTAFSTELTQNIRFFPSMAWPVQCGHFNEKDCSTNRQISTTLPIMKVKSGMLRDEDAEDHNY